MFVSADDLTAADRRRPHAPIRTFKDETGLTLSAISDRDFMTWIVSRLMPLEGRRIFEIGTGSGYLAYVLAQLTGPRGLAAGCELIPQLSEAAANNPLVAAVPWLQIRHGDFTDILPGLGEFDVVIATSSMSWLHPAMLSGCRPDGGMIALPIQIRGGGDCYTIFRRNGSALETVDSVLSISVPTVGNYALAPPWAEPVRKLIPDFDMDETLEIVAPNDLGHPVYGTLGLRSFLQAFEPLYAAVEIGADQRLFAHNMAFGLVEGGSFCLQHGDRAILGGAEGMALAERYTECRRKWTEEGRLSLADYSYRLEVDPARGHSFAPAIAAGAAWWRRR